MSVSHATRTEIRKKIDSYGDVVSDTRAPFSSASFDALVASLKTHRVESRAAGAPGAACTGGTGRSLRVRIGRRVVLDGASDRCGGKDSGTLAGDVDGWVDELDRAVPPPAATPPL